MPWPEATAGVTTEAAGSELEISALGAASGAPSGPGLPCTGNPDLFFAETPAHVEQAKALCQGCRARIGCLQGALERREDWGVWGGELLLRGTIVPRKRGRGRPRKTDPAISGQAAELTVRGNTAENPISIAWWLPT
jgi:WhiB family redox-sensing transcriptional regulator